MYKISDKFINFITKAIENRKVKLAVGGQTLAEVKVQRHPPKILIITTIIWYSNDATQLYI